MTEPVWVSRTALELLHAKSLAIFGGLNGLRDSGLLDSALACPRQTMAYGQADSLSALAAAYAMGISRNNPFADGNKRAAFLAALVFLEINGSELVFDKVDAIQTVIGVSAGEISEEQLTRWIVSRVQAI